MGLSFFWLLATLLQQDILVYIKSNLHQSNTFASLSLALCGIGIAFGSLLAGRLSGDNIETGLIPLGALGLFLSSSSIAFFKTDYFMTCLHLFGIGIFAGLILVPLNTSLQDKAPASFRGAVISVSNIFVFTGISLGAISAYFMSRLGWNSRHILMATAFFLALGTLYALYLLPQALLRVLFVILSNTLYRLRVTGKENLPEKGAAVIVPNHVSFIDWLFLLASTRRRLRFLVDSAFFKNSLFRFFLDLGGAIPVSPASTPRDILRALQKAGAHLDQGEVLCIFAEGQITRTGTLQPFRRGVERILKGRPEIPVIPVHLSQLWGSVFSFYGGRFIFKRPREFPYPVQLSYGSPLPGSATVPEIRQAVHNLGVKASFQQFSKHSSLHREFLRACSRAPSRSFLLNTGKKALSRQKVLKLALHLARKLEKIWEGKRKIALFFPSDQRNFAAQLAISLSGKVSVLLHPDHCTKEKLQDEGIDLILGDRQFIETQGIEISGAIPFIEINFNFLSISLKNSFLLTLKIYFSSISMLEKYCCSARSVFAEDTACLLITSSSKTMLTHANLLAATRAMARVMRFEKNDRLLCTLEHTEGTAFLSFWLAAYNSVALVCHENPKDASTIGKIVEKFSITLMFSNWTHLSHYIKRCSPGRFGSLRNLYVRYESDNENKSDLFENQFGFRPLSFYDSNENTALIACNVPDHRSTGFYQAGSRRDTVGQVLPHVAVKIVDVNGKEQHMGQKGTLLLQSPSLVKNLEMSSEHPDYFHSGKQALLDEDGFLKIISNS
jgi:acyl-[acyl-carrier-protein]-phospholipid O-acyltransferase/long-chain-fatty-acid--[acyl-carrier-protein] ligase